MKQEGVYISLAHAKEWIQSEGLAVNYGRGLDEEITDAEGEAPQLPYVEYGSDK